jgi:aminomethyltransferase
LQFAGKKGGYSMAKRTPFYKKHVEAGGKLVELAGFEMPIQFTGIISEVKRVRTTAGVFDVSHMGRVEVRGPNALEFVSKITTNDPATLKTFQAQYSCMCYENAGIVDDLVVYKLEDRFLLVINAANKEKDLEWMLSHPTEGAIITDVSDQMTQLAVQGPCAEAIIQTIADIDLGQIGFYWAANCRINGVQTLISRTGYTGEDGFELYFDAKYASQIWDQIMDAGKSEQIEPIGLGARDVLRLEMKYCLYGNDIDKGTTPLEAGLAWATKLNKSDFIGKSVLVKQKEEGVKRRLAAFTMEGKAIPRQHYKILRQGEQIGEVTSGGFSPSTNRPIGLGYVDVAHAKADTEIEIDCRGRAEKAVIVKPPFYKQGSRK